MWPLLLSDESVRAALGRLGALAALALPGTAGAGFTVTDGGQPTTVAGSDALVGRADELQYGLGEGPCLTAYRHRSVVRVDDTRADYRWCRWARAVERLGVRSSTSIPLLVGGELLGVLKAYSREPGAYGDRDDRVLLLLADQAATLLANRQSPENAERLRTALQEMLRARDVIGQAKGILMAREGICEEYAAAVLVRASQRGERKVNDVARHLVETLTAPAE
jgi:GAF domain-containing protein